MFSFGLQRAFCEEIFSCGIMICAGPALPMMPLSVISVTMMGMISFLLAESSNKLTSEGDAGELGSYIQPIPADVDPVNRHSQLRRALVSDDLDQKSVFLITEAFYFLPQTSEDLQVVTSEVHVVVGKEDLCLDIAADVEHAMLLRLQIATSNQSIKKWQREGEGRNGSTLMMIGGLNDMLYRSPIFVSFFGSSVDWLLLSLVLGGFLLVGLLFFLLQLLLLGSDGLEVTSNEEINQLSPLLGGLEGASEDLDLSCKEPEDGGDGLGHSVVAGDDNIDILKGSIGIAESNGGDVDIGSLNDRLPVVLRVSHNQKSGFLELLGHLIGQGTRDPSG